MADTPTAPTTSPHHGHQRQCIHMGYSCMEHALALTTRCSPAAFAKDDPKGKALRTHNLAVSALRGTPYSRTMVVLANSPSQLLTAGCAQLEPSKAHRTPLHDRVACGIPVSAHHAHTLPAPASEPVIKQSWRSCRWSSLESGARKLGYLAYSSLRPYPTSHPGRGAPQPCIPCRPPWSPLPAALAVARRRV